MAPPRLIRTLGTHALAYELARAAAQAAGRYLNPVARIAWRRACLVLVQNTETRAWLPRRHRAKVEVFPNPIIDVAIARERRALAPPTALFVGRLLAWKGAGLAVHAVARNPDWCLLFCGTGGDEEPLRRLVQRLGLDERVRFLGSQTRPEVLRLMSSSADVLLFPSLREDAGWVVVEALACGLPVICVDRGGPPVLAGEAGLAAPIEGRIDAVASALARLLDLNALPSEEQVRERARHFSTESTLTRLQELLMSVGPPVSPRAKSHRT